VSFRKRVIICLDQALTAVRRSGLDLIVAKQPVFACTIIKQLACSRQACNRCFKLLTRRSLEIKLSVAHWPVLVGISPQAQFRFRLRRDILQSASWMIYFSSTQYIFAVNATFRPTRYEII
jgi:hypothetical protein